ncbi:orotidine-5'-phosphate decarboxylase [Saccharothrix longispora]|uniref:orotidine-5'-phosphate decarboxylase n=1 Tax=Saccharothrix longispora TaxID=33920 RepID=UPI0028FDC45A|nr:orotidine-5'-phosphate decarboxylase [Saccharothrix longispora]MDU0288046.1 orotidine-5'-phosphate decarboxylase [Saccharothrix longispora]
MRFGERLGAAVAEHGPLCVGIDPHPGLLASWGLTQDVAGLERFARTCVEAFGGRVALVKPQSAFFEAHGSRGVAVLERVISDLRDSGTLVLVDAKRGDIGSTMAAYAAAYLTEGSPLAGDAVTVSPYLGFGSLAPALDAAAANGRGIFALALTSNPEGASVQRATGPDGRSVAQSVVDAAARANAGLDPLGDVGLVIGATVGDHGLDLSDLHGYVLAPGFGAQGATVADLRAVFGPELRGVLPASSRDVLGHGPGTASLRSAVDAVRRSLEM